MQHFIFFVNAAFYVLIDAAFYVLLDAAFHLPAVSSICKKPTTNL
jgi:hypothetical protein